MPFETLAKKENIKKRKRQADALRSIRLCDRSMATHVLKLWKVRDETERAVMNTLLYGIGAVKIEEQEPLGGGGGGVIFNNIENLYEE